MSIANSDLKALYDRFVCVRMVQMWNVDLAKFQFDGSLTLSVFFMNQDGTIYGRYGTRDRDYHSKLTFMSVASFKKSMAKALALHERFTSAGEDEQARLRTRLKAKVGPPPLAPTIEKLPGLKRLWEFNNKWNKGGPSKFSGRVSIREGGCLHCHMVPRSEVYTYWAKSKPVPSRYSWPYPTPDVVGLQMEPAEVATIKTVEKGSDAQRSGFLPGDEILSLDEQPILSIADIQWVLHLTEGAKELPVTVKRNGKERALALALGKEWRSKTDATWRGRTVSMTQYGVTGFQAVQCFTRPVKHRSFDWTPPPGIDPTKKCAMWLRRLGPHAKAQGLQRNDKIVEVDGSRAPMNVSSFANLVFRKKTRPGSSLELVVVRNGKELKIHYKLPAKKLR